MTDAQYNIKKLEEKIEKQKALIKELLNELCLRCGNYKNEHLGACNDCRWYLCKENLKNDQR